MGKFRGDWWGTGDAAHSFENWAQQWSWKREGLPVAVAQIAPYKHPRPGSREPLVISQQPMDTQKGFWGSYVTDADIVLTGYLERCVRDGSLKPQNLNALQLSAGPGLAGVVLSEMGARVTITNQTEDKMRALNRNAARVEAVEGVEPPTTAVLSMEEVVADTDSKASLPSSLILSSDEYLVYDDDAARLLVATLSRLSGFDTEIILAYGRNRGGEEELEQRCKGLFSIEEVGFKALHPVYRTVSDDVKVLRLTRLGEPIAVGPQACHSPKSASLVPASPHLQGKQAPKSPGLERGSGSNLLERQKHAIRHAIKKQQLRAFAKMPRRCRFLWWLTYRQMMRDKQDRLALKSLAEDSSFVPF